MRGLSGAVTGESILQWQENSSPGVFQLKSATAKGSNDATVKVLFSLEHWLLFGAHQLFTLGI